MSRGLGRAERAVLAYLAERAKRDPEWAARLELIADQAGIHPESARRAMKTLAAKGLVELGHDGGWRTWGQMYRTACPTARLSAEYLSTLNEAAQ